MRKQFFGIDLLRILACVLVLLTHACECYYISNFYAGGGFENLDIATWQSEAVWAGLFDSFSHCCVPIFVMISGFLLLPMKPGMSMGEFYRKRASRILIPLAVWTVVYSFYCTFKMESGLVSVSDYALSILKGIGFFFINFPAPIGHLWYVYMILGIYLIIPILSPWVERASRRQMRLIIGVWLLLTPVPFLRLVWPELWGECSWNPFGAHQYISGFIGYLLAGAYARKFLFDSKQSYKGIGLLLTVLGFVGAAAGILYQIYYMPPTAETFGNYWQNFEITWFFCGLPMCLETFGLFLLFFRWSPKQIPAVMSDFSRLSYGVYLCHIMFLTWFYEEIFLPLALPTPVSILAICACTVITSYLVIKLLSFLPKSKWIVG